MVVSAIVYLACRQVYAYNDSGAYMYVLGVCIVVCNCVMVRLRVLDLDV